MENDFEITISNAQDSQSFEVKKLLTQEEAASKFEVFRDGHLVLTVEPDSGYLRTCKNPGGLDEEIIHKVIERIEAYHL